MVAFFVDVAAGVSRQPVDQGGFRLAKALPCAGFLHYAHGVVLEPCSVAFVHSTQAPGVRRHLLVLFGGVVEGRGVHVLARVKLVAALLLAVPIIDLLGLGRDATARIRAEEHEGRVVGFRALLLTRPALQAHGTT